MDGTEGPSSQSAKDLAINLSKGSNTLELRLIKETVFKDNKVILKEIKLEL